MCWCERHLFNLCKIVLRILIQSDFPDATQWKLFLGKCFRQIERIERKIFRLFVRDDLDVKRPTGTFSSSNGVIQIGNCIIRLFTSENLRRLRIQILDALIRLGRKRKEVTGEQVDD